MAMTKEQHDTILQRAVAEVTARLASEPPSEEDLAWWAKVEGEAEYWREHDEGREEDQCRS